MPQPYTVTYVIRDAKNSLSTAQFFLDSTADANEAAAAAREAMDIIRPLLSGSIDSANITLPLDISGLAPSQPQPDADVEEGARFDFRSGTGAEFKTAQRLATFREALILPGTRQVDRGDPLMIAYETAMTSNIVGTNYGGTVPVRVVDSRNEGVVELRSAVESFLRSRSTR